MYDKNDSIIIAMKSLVEQTKNMTVEEFAKLYTSCDQHAGIGRRTITDIYHIIDLPIKMFVPDTTALSGDIDTILVKLGFTVVKKEQGYMHNRYDGEYHYTYLLSLNDKHYTSGIHTDLWQNEEDKLNDILKNIIIIDKK